MTAGNSAWIARLDFDLRCHDTGMGAMRKVINVDAQGREELMRLARKMNERFREIEDRCAERSDGGRSNLPAMRVVVLPASEEQIAEAEAAKARKRGTPPL